MRHYLKYLAPAALLALLSGVVMSTKLPTLLGARSAAVAATRSIPPIDVAQPKVYETATFAFG